MKKFKIILFFAFAILIFSCSKDEQTDIPDQLDIDLGIEKRQNVIGNWTPPPCIDLTIFMDGTCGPNWAGALGPAINAYNAVPDAAINMVQVFAEPADIVITCVDFANANSFGLGAWPDTDGQIQGEIYLNTDFENCGGSACFFQGAIMHEISHNLGFGHGNQQGGQASTGSWTFNPATGTFTQDNNGATLPLVHVDGTPQGNGDPQSIFNPHLCTDNICNFTNADIIAMQDVYPACGCPALLDDICDCPVADICDCPDLVEDPCDCPEAFPDEVEVTCYCVCFQGLGNPLDITEIACGTEICSKKGSIWPCFIRTECERLPTCDDGIMNGDETGIDCGGPDCDPCDEDPVCYCDCVIGGVSTSFVIDCSQDCNTNGFGTCVKRWE